MLLMAKKCLNDRPLGAKFHNSVEPGYSPITPNLLVHGYYDEQDVAEMTGDLESIGDLAKRVKLMQARHAAWWEVWYQECFEQMMPLPRWKVAHRNLQVGDICLLGFHSGLGPGVYHLCRVTKVFLDGEGLVRVKINCVEAYWPLISEIMTDYEYADEDLHELVDEASVPEAGSSNHDTAPALISHVVQAELHGVDVSTVTPVLVPITVIGNLIDPTVRTNDLTDSDDTEYAVSLVPQVPHTDAVTIRLQN